MSAYFSSQQQRTSQYPQLIEMTSTSRFAQVRLDIVGGSSELADDARVRLLDLQRLWLDEDADSGLASLRSSSQAAIPVAPETILLLGLASTLGAEPGMFDDPSSEHGRRPLDLDRTSGHLDQQSTQGSIPTLPRLDFAAMTVTLDAPLTDAVLGSLRSWSSGLTVDLVVADLAEAGAWGASVSVGGVVRTFGLAEHGGSWTVRVLPPDGCTRVVELGDGALASSDRAAVQPERTHPRCDGPQQPDDITWAAVQAEMAWQAQVMAGGLVGLDEEAARARLDGHAETALLYRRDGQMREICPAQFGRAGAATARR
jgi:hypothetical protein